MFGSFWQSCLARSSPSIEDAVVQSAVQIVPTFRRAKLCGGFSFLFSVQDLFLLYKFFQVRVIFQTLVYDIFRFAAGEFDGRQIAGIGDFKIFESALLGAGQLAHASKLQIQLGQFKTIAVFAYGLQSLWDVVSRWQKKTVRRVLASAHAAAELVQLGKAKPLCAF